VHDAASTVPNRHRCITNRVVCARQVSHGGYRLFGNQSGLSNPMMMNIIKTPEIVRMSRPFAAFAVLSTAAAVLTLAACGGSSPVNPKQTNFKSLPAGEQQAFETSAVQEVEASVLSFTETDPTALFLLNKVASKRFTGGLRMAGSKTTPRFQNSGSCSSLVGNSNDEDQDGVVDADSATFACADTASGEIITENGYWSFGDPTPTTADLDINDAANLTLAVTGSQDGNISLVLAGQAAITQAASSLNLTGNWSLNETLANNPQNENGTFKLSANENATFTWTGATPTYFGTLTQGTVSLSGNWSYDINTTSDQINLAFSVSTPTIITIDRNGCTSNDAGIVSGEVDIKFADGTLVKASWSGCPVQPSITVS
jgi:hypothetical protein